ncbi:MAG: TatD family hydrolase, partial [Bacteroidales bacterium]|nr:TatD family hydrolase [Bacteroidales bacterium]
MQNTYYYIDTHSHMYLPQFDEDIDSAVERALQKKVSKIVLPNIDKESIAPLVALTNKYPNVFFPLMGLHPTHIKENHVEELEAVLSEFKYRNYHGVGEIGIDLYWDKTFFNEQCEVFKQQIEFALEKNLPIVIHARDSFDEIIKVLEKIGTTEFNGIFHAFTGTTKQAQQIIDFGFKIGIGGIVTFK